MIQATTEAPARGTAAPVSATMRTCSYAEALREGLSQAMELSERVCVLGQLVDSLANTSVARMSDRVQDFAVAESAMTAAAMGAAIAGMRPVLVHHRLDFMLYSLDAIVNWLSLWRFKSNSGSGIPLIIRAIVGKGWGQGPQHSKSLHAWFAHLPGAGSMGRNAIP